MIALMSAALSAMLAFSGAAPSVPPQERIIAKMLLIEVAQDGDLNRASGNQYHGQCRRFQADSLLEAAQGFAPEGQPGVTLVLPIDHVPQEESGRPVGAVWSAAEEGTACAYEQVAAFDFDGSMSAKMNRQAAQEFLSQALAGDILQIIAVYSSGERGTHTLMITQPYDPRDDVIYWCDSNFANKRIDGVKYGYVRARQAWAMNDVTGWLGVSANTGATLYRLRTDLVEAP